MQYYLCPRCQFRVAANKQVCTTCGFNIASLKNNQAAVVEQAPVTKVAKNGFFSKFMGAQPSTKEPREEKPALG